MRVCLHQPKADIRSYFQKAPKKPEQSSSPVAAAKATSKKPAQDAILIDDDDDFQPLPVKSKYFSGESDSTSGKPKASKKRATIVDSDEEDEEPIKPAPKKVAICDQKKESKPEVGIPMDPTAFFATQSKGRSRPNEAAVAKKAASPQKVAASSTDIEKLMDEKERRDIELAMMESLGDAAGGKRATPEKKDERKLPWALGGESSKHESASSKPVSKPPTPKKEVKKIPSNTKHNDAKDDKENEDNPTAKKNSGYALYMKKKASGGPSNPGSKEIPEGEENCLLGLTFVFSGELSSISRDDATDLAKRYGGRVTGAVSGKTSYLVVGDEAGASKTAKAEKEGIPVIDEDKFLDLIRNSPGKSEGSSAPSKGKGKGKQTPTKAAATKGEAYLEQPKSGALKRKAPELLAESRAQASVISPTASSYGNGDMWTIKYKPKSYSDLMGNKSNVTKLAKWLKDWSPNADVGKPGKDDPGNAKAILISGPPGIGKTTAAHLVAELEGYEAIEFNASDTRSKKSVKELIKEMTGNHSVSEYFIAANSRKSTKKAVLIMDEVDGMSAGDRGGVQELINVIKKTQVDELLKSLTKLFRSQLFAFAMIGNPQKSNHWPQTSEVEKAIKEIATREGLELKINVVDNLLKSTQGDIRQIMNLLQTFSLQAKTLTFDGSKALAKLSEKNTTIGVFDAIAKLLGKMSFREMSLNEKLDLYFAEFSLMPLFVQENYIKMEPAMSKDMKGNVNAIEELALLAQAADSIAQGDIIDNTLRKTNSWTLMPLVGMTSTVRPCFFVHGSMAKTAQPAYGPGSGYGFPGWLGKNSTSGKNWRLLKEIQMHMRLRVSADKNEMRQNYLPTLARKLTSPLAEKQTDGIDEVIGTMDDYYLSREDWDSVLELCLNECSAKTLTTPIATATKSSFTRIYNKSSHPQPLLTAASVAKIKAAKASAEIPDLEEAIELDEDPAEEENDEDVDEDSIDADRLIKRPKNDATAASSSKAGSKGKGSTSTRGRGGGRGGRGGKR
ncbi:hypothetical protein HDU97_010330 [Phlyctochytrium planicorne]|nr:hypothetical protein HDU97_010330 [Phlyctochytrium planicorne]